MNTEEKQELAIVNPAELYRVATNVAGVCGEIVKKTAVEIQHKKYVKVEGWEAIAAAHGCFAGADSADRAYDANGEHIGYQAKGYIRNGHGEVIGTGEGFVGFDEVDRKGSPTWKNRAEYAGRAMAQTRAISRAARSVFAHVVVLIDAGLSTTPFEEVPLGGFVESENGHPGERPQSSFHQAKQVMQGDWRTGEIHFGKNKGVKLTELNAKQLHWYSHDWVDGKLKDGARVSREDRVLIDNLLQYRRESEAFKAEVQAEAKRAEEANSGPF